MDMLFVYCIHTHTRPHVEVRGKVMAALCAMYPWAEAVGVRDMLI